MSQPVDAKCSREFLPAYHSSGERKLSAVIWIVLHDTEGGSAEGVARYFKTKGSGGSAHLVVDDNCCYRCLENEDVPWGAPGANEDGFHIEQCGFAKWSAVVWRKHIRTIKRAAYKSALHCKLFGIPVRYVKAAGLEAGTSGITTHREVSKAFGGDHSDPGPFYPIPLFMWWCRRYRKQLG